MKGLSRQKHAGCFDSAFKHLNIEICCLEIGLEFEGQNGTKLLQERGLKIPRMMKAFSLALTEQYPTIDLDQMKIVEIVVSGEHLYTINKTLNVC